MFEGHTSCVPNSMIPSGNGVTCRRVATRTIKAGEVSVFAAKHPGSETPDL